MGSAKRATNFRSSAVLLSLALALSGCEGFEMPKFSLGAKKSGGTSEPVVNDSSTRLVERDVEAPDVFQVTDQALWDGRPSLGGVWVAFPGDIEPERVIIRNEENNKFVIGALFRRERENPGPKIQLSSDAAAALGILAGKPTVLNVTALRRESVPDETEVADPAKAEEKSLEAIAAAAIGSAEGNKTSTVTTEPVTAPATPAPKAVSGLAKPFIQIGIFSIETNAKNTATSLRTQGVVPIIKAQETKGKKFWRVLIGPASNKSERANLLKIAKKLGFGDAYFVSR